MTVTAYSKRRYLFTQFVLKIFTGDTLAVVCNLLWRSLCHDTTSGIATIGPEVNDPVGILHHLEIVLNDKDGMPTFNELIEGVEKFGNVMKMQTRRGLIKDKQGWVLFLTTDEISELHALVLTTGEGRRILTQLI